MTSTQQSLGILVTKQDFKMIYATFIFFQMLVIYSNGQMRPLNWDQGGSGSRGFGQGSGNDRGAGRDFFGNNFGSGQMFPRRPFSGENDRPSTRGTSPPGTDTVQFGSIPGMGENGGGGEGGGGGGGIFVSGPQPPVSRRPVEIPGPGQRSRPRPSQPDPESTPIGPLGGMPEGPAPPETEPNLGQENPTEMELGVNMGQRPNREGGIGQINPMLPPTDNGELGPSSMIPSSRQMPGQEEVGGPQLSSILPGQQGMRQRPIRQDGDGPRQSETPQMRPGELEVRQRPISHDGNDPQHLPESQVNPEYNRGQGPIRQDGFQQQPVSLSRPEQQDTTQHPVREGVGNLPQSEVPQLRPGGQDFNGPQQSPTSQSRPELNMRQGPTRQNPQQRAEVDMRAGSARQDLNNNRRPSTLQSRPDRDMRRDARPRLARRDFNNEQDIRQHSMKQDGEGRNQRSSVGQNGDRPDQWGIHNQRQNNAYNQPSRF